ncbi:MAG: hypothetical protein FWE88_08275 [Phycisphaerae bacterium]|nr:hypothetical protein [Phycisphaerae bacterium]
MLPLQPDLEHLKGEAKGLLKAHAKGDASACPVFRRLRRFAQADDSQILSAAVTLTETQFALALDYGLTSWDDLRRVVRSVRPLKTSNAPPSPRALRIPDPQAGKGGNRFARALEMMFHYCGIPCDYDTVACDSGLAFILQADSQHAPYGTCGADVKELDVGWWPLDDWGAMLRLDFLGRAYGIALRRLPIDKEAWHANPARHFRDHHQAAIVEALQTERPVVAVENGTWIVTGIDDGTPELLGQASCEATAHVKRLGQYPWTVVVPGEMFEPLDRVRADGEAILFAASLHDERFGESFSGCPFQSSRNQSSGKASFALWAAILRDGQRCGPSYYSGNVVGCMKQNRQSAPPYLRQMASRHGSAIAGHLMTAAEIYESVLATLDTADTSDEAFASVTGRETLASLVDELAKTEAKAVAELQAAARKMKA